MKALIAFAVTAAFVIVLSSVSVNIWGGKPEKLPDAAQLKITPEMTVQDFMSANHLERPVIKNLFGLSSPADLQKKLTELGTPGSITAKYNKLSALKAESESKNWLKIPLKFAMWAVFLTTLFGLLRKKQIEAGNRKWLYAAAFILFGVVMGSDPGPMGTVKDAVYLYGKSGAVFPPRLVAMSLFFLTVILANKFICSWGCQAGTLQDFIFRLGRNDKDTGAGAVNQFRIPFVLSNSVRALVFAAMFAAAFMYSLDLFGVIDPFKVFKPQAVGIAGGAAIAVIFLLSLYTYRPWCLLVCPFGFLGWMLEKISLFRVRVNYSKCIACNKCSDACPSTVMDAILKQDKMTIPDCFSCGVCTETCPTGAVTFSRGSREKVPEGKFKS